MWAILQMGYKKVVKQVWKSHLPGTDSSTKAQKGMKMMNASTRKQLRRRREDMARLVSAMSFRHTLRHLHLHIILRALLFIYYFNVW